MFSAFLADIAGATARVLKRHALPADFKAIATLELRFSDQTLHSATLRRQEPVDLTDRALAGLLIRRCRVDDRYSGRITVDMDLDHGSVAAIAFTARQSYKPDALALAGDVVTSQATDAVLERLSTALLRLDEKPPDPVPTGNAVESGG